jgi:hypothetical protein
MKSMLSPLAVGLCCLATIALPQAGFAQDDPNAGRQLPPGTNPFQRMVYPAEGQDVNQQQTDQLECYWWSSDQLGGWDPYVAHAELQREGYIAADQAASAQGGGVRGAAGGALGGLAIGAIAGDAGTGAAIGAVAGGLIGGSRSRRAQQSAQAKADAAINAFTAEAERWDRAWVGCMQARDYSIT